MKRLFFSPPAPMFIGDFAMRNASRLCIVIFFFQAVFIGVAQNNSGSDKPAVKKQPPRQDRLIVDLYHDNWLNKPDSIKTKWYSYGVAVSILYDNPIGKSNFSFAAGPGISCHNVHSNAHVANLNDTTSALFPYPSDYKYTKNKFSTTYGDVIAELRYRTSPNKQGYSWKFSVGGRYGYLLNVHDMLRDKTGKYKTFIFPYTTQKAYGLHFRAAYGRVGIFGFYSLTNLFKKDRGVVFTPFSAGISIMPM